MSNGISRRQDLALEAYMEHECDLISEEVARTRQADKSIKPETTRVNVESTKDQPIDLLTGFKAALWNIMKFKR